MNHLLSFSSLVENPLDSACSSVSCIFQGSWPRAFLRVVQKSEQLQSTGQASGSWPWEPTGASCPPGSRGMCRASTASLVQPRRRVGQAPVALLNEPGRCPAPVAGVCADEPLICRPQSWPAAGLCRGSPPISAASSIRPEGASTSPAGMLASLPPRILRIQVGSDAHGREH